MFFSLLKASQIRKICSFNFINYNQYIRRFSKNIDVPLSQLSFNYSRSSGPGGQNVNKVNTKVELRMKIDDCEFIPQDAKNRLYSKYKNKINSENELIIKSQETRYQNKNRNLCIEKLKEIISDVSIVPVERITIFEPSEVEKQRRIVYKRKRSDIKQNRKGRNIDNLF